jgi:hypothetical protein
MTPWNSAEKVHELVETPTAPLQTAPSPIPSITIYEQVVLEIYLFTIKPYMLGENSKLSTAERTHLPTTTDDEKAEPKPLPKRKCRKTTKYSK